MVEPTPSQPTRPYLHRVWWLYVLLALGNFALAGWHAKQGRPGWGVSVLLYAVLGVCFLGMGLLGRRTGRVGR